MLVYSAEAKCRIYSRHGRCIGCVQSCLWRKIPCGVHGREARAILWRGSKKLSVKAHWNLLRRQRVHPKWHLQHFSFYWALTRLAVCRRSGNEEKTGLGKTDWLVADRSISQCRKGRVVNGQFEHSHHRFSVRNLSSETCICSGKQTRNSLYAQTWQLAWYCRDRTLRFKPSVHRNTKDTRSWDLEKPTRSMGCWSQSQTTWSVLAFHRR